MSGQGELDIEMPENPGDDDNITDWCLEQFQNHYKNTDITKDDIWEYLYGVMHAPDWRERYKHDLQRNFPRVPFAADFEAFLVAGRQLMYLHVNYETVEEWDVVCTVDNIPNDGESDPDTDPDAYRIADGKKMGWLNKTDRSVLKINERCRLIDIPIEAQGYSEEAPNAYTVSGRSPLEWAIDSLRYKDAPVGRDNPNKWYVWEDEPFNLIRHLRRLIAVSVETTRIVNNLPPSLPPDSDD